MEFTLVYRSKVIIKAYEGWLSPSERVLDVGCGNCVVIDELRRHFKISPYGTDILDYRKREIPFRLMKDAQKLPFKDREFDVAMFNDALHHCDDQDAILAEAARVANRILIFEMEPTLTAKVAEVLINQIHNPNMNIPFNIKAPEEWVELFKKFKFDFEYRKIKKPLFFYPFINFSFCLRNKT